MSDGGILGEDVSALDAILAQWTSSNDGTARDLISRIHRNQESDSALGGFSLSSAGTALPSCRFWGSRRNSSSGSW